jgi:hypothetical protein
MMEQTDYNLLFRWCSCARWLGDLGRRALAGPARVRRHRRQDSAAPTIIAPAAELVTTTTVEKGHGRIETRTTPSPRSSIGSCPPTAL